MALKKNVKTAEPKETETQETEVPETEVDTNSDIKLTSSQEIATANAGITTFMESAEADGFEGLELSRQSFAGIVLDTSEFVETNSGERFMVDDVDYGESFRFVPVSSKKKILHRFMPPGSVKSEDAILHVCYGSDPISHTGDDINQVKALMEDDGLEHSSSIYSEVVAMVVPLDATDDTEVVTLAMLSIPPASKAGLTGCIANYNARNRTDPITKLSTAILQAKLGKKKKNKNSDSYIPWAFTAIAKL